MARILTLGMAVLDHVFRVGTFPDAGEKYRADAYAAQIGGPATIAAIAVSRLGGEAQLCTRLGSDPNSMAISRELDEAGVNWQPSFMRADALAPVSSVFVRADGERQIVNFRGHNLQLSADAITPEILDGVDAVLVDPRWPEGAERLVALARERKIAVVIDAESDLGTLEGAMKQASHIIFSTQGLRDLSGEGDVVEGLKACGQRYEGWLGVTQGAAGVVYLDQGAVAHVASFPVEARDTLGAGDVWHGAFALAVGEGRNARQAARFANAAAALKCRNGAGWRAIPSRDEVLALMAGGSIH